MSTAEIREFPTSIIATISTGVMLCNDFSKVHEATEFLMGHPIWTHHFADKALQSEMQAAVQEQCPGIPTKIEGVTRENWQEKMAAIIADCGPVQRIRKGSGLTAMLPTDGIPDHLKDNAITISK